MKLSIIVATYDMQREAPRTIQSMLPPIQKAVTGADYEIIVIDNGSDPALTLDMLDTGGVRLRVHRVPPASSYASPVFTINDCVARMAEGQFVMICIDGARLLSPYTVRRTLDALANDENAFSYIGSRHLGQEVQSHAVRKGYDQTAEDALLQSVDWTQDADRLNKISVWAGAHRHQNAFTQNESNAFALSRALWDQTGGYREGFARAGGGLCNLEIFNRMVERPNGQNILLLGETTFHQVHGGAATSNVDYFQASLEEFKAVTGYEYHLPSYDFKVDVGAQYGRQKVIEEWYA